jgi:hypothetical protein
MNRVKTTCSIIQLSAFQRRPWNQKGTTRTASYTSLRYASNTTKTDKHFDIPSILTLQLWIMMLFVMQEQHNPSLSGTMLLVHDTYHFLKVRSLLKKRKRDYNTLNLLAPELFFAHPVYKMWITQEPNMLELRNKPHFEEEKTKSIYHV